jgi:hypothetical protein
MSPHPLRTLVRATVILTGLCALGLAALTLAWTVSRWDGSVLPFLAALLPLAPVGVVGMRCVRAGVTGRGAYIERFLRHVDRAADRECLRVEGGLAMQARALERAARAPRPQPPLPHDGHA